MDGEEMRKVGPMEQEKLAHGPKEPTVGRIVHFYTKNTSRHYNGQGEGPYVAIVTRTWGGLMANLKVIPGFGEIYDAGSVSHQSAARPEEENWWVWPPII